MDTKYAYGRIRLSKFEVRRWTLDVGRSMFDVQNLFPCDLCGLCGE
jgi:hypothetical protein